MNRIRKPQQTGTAQEPPAPPATAVLDWLLQGDPSIRWQTMRDLLDRPEREWSAERERVAREGWGTRLLAEQSPDGRWGGGLYSPKWVSTHYTLLLLRSLGLPPIEPARRAATQLLDGGFQPDGGIRASRAKAEPGETCVTGMTLAMTTCFRLNDERNYGMVEHLLRVQTPDGGWNCLWRNGSRHGSFHTTISALEGLLEYERMYPEQADAARAAGARGREFLLVHRLFRSHTTGAVVSEAMTRFSFPPQWHYDVLRGLDYFQAAAAPRDDRLDDAIGLLTRKRRKDGTWPLQNRHPGPLWFEMEEVGKPSRWNTLRALRVLRWWES
jgi:hypothetical protein